MLRSVFVLVAGLALVSFAGAQKPFQPSPEEVRASYARYAEIDGARRDAVKLTLAPHWLEGGARFWYRNALLDDKKEFWLVESATGKRTPAFDAKRLAEALAKASGKPVDAAKLPFDDISFSDGLKAVRFSFDNKRWEYDLSRYEIKSTEGREESEGGRQGRRGQGTPPGPRPNRSPDGKWTAKVEDEKLKVTGENDAVAYVCPIESVASARWSPDSKKLVVMKLIKGDRKPVYLIRSSSSRGTRGEMLSRLYDQPGDKLDEFETYIVDPFMKSETKVELPQIWTGGHPWAGPPGIDWIPGTSEFLIDYAERGYGRYFVDAVSVETGKRRSVIDEDPDTFFDTTSSIMRLLQKSPELFWRSERDGFGRLYRVDAMTGAVENVVTPPNWIVRSIEWVDEDAKRLCFTANNIDAGQDPYFIHAFTVGFDGKNLVRLTDGAGTHRIDFAPDRKTFVDTWSRVDFAPVHELRRTDDGKKLAELERADLSAWTRWKIPMPEVFVAKGRDAKTDIWGIVVRPTTLDPKKSYPIIENIYAGPHDSFVPKSFSPLLNMQKLAELGFIVVQIDGMGTDNRGKAFHDVAYKNIADAGFPDRILWMKALAKKYAYVDDSRVGVYGTSAGGQNSAAAVLFHPEFYKAAFSACGCHDNRIDKLWWNEQWMGPMGPHYEAQSNITNAGKLQGKLMLLVGELDTNVPPESTYRFADALIKAGKDFELVVMPGMDHTSGGPYGDRKRNDFFIRNLLGSATPNWNEPKPEPGKKPVRG